LLKADSYYELLALDNQLTTVKQKYSIASALEICKIQRSLPELQNWQYKNQAEVLASKSKEFQIKKLLNRKHDQFLVKVILKTDSRVIFESITRINSISIPSYY
jgi:hypothetical protein